MVVMIPESSHVLEPTFKTLKIWPSEFITWSPTFISVAGTIAEVLTVPPAVAVAQ